MRYVIPAFAAVMLALPPWASQAQTAAQAPSTMTTTQPAPAAASAPGHPGRMNKMMQKFAAANTTKDGHLTLDQAKAAKWRVIAKNFAAIDVAHKGYVTTDDIKAAAAAHRAAKMAKPATSG